MTHGSDETHTDEQSPRPGRRRRVRGGAANGRDSRDNTRRGPGQGPCGQEDGGHGEHASICLPPGREREFPAEADGHAGRHGRGRRGGRGRKEAGRARARRGDIRTAVLLLLAQQPMHGYHIMQEIARRTDDAWRPGPSAVYPTIAQLEDEGLITITREGGQKLAALTDEGMQQVQDLPPAAAELLDSTEGRSPSQPGLRQTLDEVQVATRAVTASGSAAQIEAVRQTLAETRRTIYRILADEIPDTGTADPEPPA